MLSWNQDAESRCGALHMTEAIADVTTTPVNPWFTCHEAMERGSGIARS